MREGGLEPPPRLLSGLAPQASASTSSAILAWWILNFKERMREGGLEPPPTLLCGLAPQASASTSSAILAFFKVFAQLLASNGEPYRGLEQSCQDFFNFKILKQKDYLV